MGCGDSEPQQPLDSDGSTPDVAVEVEVPDTAPNDTSDVLLPDVSDPTDIEDVETGQETSPGDSAQDSAQEVDSSALDGGDVFDPVEFCDDDNPCTLDSWDGELCDHVYQYGICCTSNAMCDDDDTCTLDRCAEGLCEHEVLCCETDGQCSDNDALCTSDHCVDGWCLYTPVVNESCCSPEILVESFDTEPLTSLIIQNSSPVVGWHVSTQNGAVSEPASLWYGNPETNNYDSGTGHNGVVRIPTKKLPSGVGLTLSFDVYLDIESPKGFDIFEVRIIAPQWSQSVLVWSKEDSTGPKEWQPVSINLTAYSGQPVQVHFVFDSVDEVGNDGLGVLLDNIRLESSCVPVECVLDEDCNDGLAATADRCIGGVCTSIPNTYYCEASTDCDDGEPCTANYCTNNVCVYQTLTNCCILNADCDDGLPCTMDDCVGANANKGGFCNHITIPDCCLTEATCDDGDPCTVDSCEYPGAICGHEVIVGCCFLDTDCDDGDPCTLDACGPSGCTHIQECCLVDMDCDDNDTLCTQDMCVDGQCVYDFVNLPGCCSETVWQESFTGPSMGTFELSADNPSIDGVQGHAVTSPTLSAGGAVQFSGGWGTYATGSATAGSVRSFSVNLPSDAISALQFQLHLDTEYSNGVGNVLWDRLQVWVEYPPYDDQSEVLLWDSGWGDPVWWMEEGGTPIGPQWTLVDGLDLSPFQGMSIRVRVDFDSIDGDSNHFGGPTLDDFTILSTCTP